MTAPFRPLFLVLAGVLLAGVQLAAAEAAPATIRTVAEGTRRASSFDPAFVLSESVDGIEFAVDDARSANKLSLKYGTYVVEYGDAGNTDYLRGKAQEEAGTLDKAYESFQRAAQGAKFAWVREDAVVRGANAALAVKKPDEALALIAQLEKDAPRSVHFAEALLARGQAQVAKGDAAGAGKTFTTLTAMAKEWGEPAAIYGARGQAGLLSAAGKPAEAADVLAKLLARLDVSKLRDDIGLMVFELATAQRAAGKPDDALKTIQSCVWRDIRGAHQARLHVLWGQILADQGTLPEAFDQAALAAVTKGIEPATQAAAKALAQAINDKLAKDPAVSAADKAEYKRSLSQF